MNRSRRPRSFSGVVGGRGSIGAPSGRPECWSGSLRADLPRRCRVALPWTKRCGEDAVLEPCRPADAWGGQGRRGGGVVHGVRQHRPGLPGMRVAMTTCVLPNGSPAARERIQHCSGMALSVVTALACCRPPRAPWISSGSERRYGASTSVLALEAAHLAAVSK
jgi:hypothetical protein